MATSHHNPASCFLTPLESRSCLAIRPRHLQSPTLLHPGLTLNWLLKTILLRSCESPQGLTVPSSVLHMVPHMVPPALLVELLARLITPSFSFSPEFLHRLTQFLVFPQIVTVCHRIPHSSSQLPQVTHTRPHTPPTVSLIIHHKLHTHVPHAPHTISHTSLVPTQLLTQFVSSFTTSSTHTSLTFLTPSHTLL